jgi:hypothetical protein
MGFEIKGKIKKIFEQQDFPSGFYKRDFVITTEEQYPQDVKFTAVKERTEQIAKLQEGDLVLVKFDIRGREYNDNFYVDLNAWRVESAEAGAPGSAEVVAATPMPDVPPMPTAPTVDDDDLPF